jgi:hypothetical protein
MRSISPLTAASFQGTDDAIVHRRTRPLVLRAIHRQTRFEQRLLLVAVNPTITLRFIADFDVDSEPLERARGQQRRVLEPSPIDRRSQDSQALPQNVTSERSYLDQKEAPNEDRKP